VTAWTCTPSSSTPSTTASTATCHHRRRRPAAGDHGLVGPRRQRGPLVAHLGTGQELRNIARDSRVAVSFEAPGTAGPGLLRYAVLHGSARLTEGGAPALLQELAPRFLGPGVKFPPMDDPPEGQVIHITVERVTGAGPWA
jgi:hypothetical protein